MPAASRTFAYRAEIARAEAAQRADRRRTAAIAKRLGVTGTGLTYLAQADATGHMRGGMGTIKLVHQGYATERVGTVGAEITDAGREIVKRARQLGW